MEGFCRGCLNTFDNPTDLLRYTEERRRQFVYSTGLQVKRNDTFPFQLCRECHFSMKTSCKFKKMCRSSDRKIRNYVALKEDDDSFDFNILLKRNDGSLTFRFPSLSGRSTPAKQNVKDDDNESTCTSIQNFMTDILRADEIPDSEARIIRQVIEEEADVLEDSLDSHWLEDDMTDDELQADLSRFSTPKSSNHDRMKSPCNRGVRSGDLSLGEDYDNIPIDVALKKLCDPLHSFVSQYPIVEGVEVEKNKNRCVIDKNLEKALKNETNQEFLLEELLASPVLPSKSGASTPTIEQILFGDQIKTSKKFKSPKYEPEFDLFLGKLDIVPKSREEQEKGKFNFVQNKVKTPEKSHSIVTKSNIKSEKGTLSLGKIKETETKKIYWSQFPCRKMLQEKLNYSKGKLYEENIELNNKNLVNEKLENIIVEKFDSEELKPNFEDGNGEKQDGGNIDMNIEMLLEDRPFEPNNGKSDEELQNEEFEQPNLEMLLEGRPFEPNNGNAEELHNEEFNQLNVEILLEDRPLEPNNGNAEELQNEEIDQPNIENLEYDGGDGILDEFINREYDKLAIAEKKKQVVTDMIAADELADEELKRLLNAYNYSDDLTTGKELLDTQSPERVEVLPKMLSPVEKKYCTINFYCKMCCKKLKNLKALKIHFAKLHDYKISKQKVPWRANLKICDLCGKTFTSNKSLVHHLENHVKPDEYKCGVCTLTFRTEHALNHHKNTHVPRADAEKTKKNMSGTDTKFVCKVCGVTSSTASNRALHERRHARSYSLRCDRCDRGFYRSAELAAHMRGHTGEKPFPCSFCEKRFSRRDILNRHMKRHTDEKIYSCEYCSERFVRIYDVKFHQKNHCSSLQ